MAGRLTSAGIAAPGFLGLNTAQAAASTREGFASVLQNAVFDDDGKLAARRGFSKLADGTPDSVSSVYWWRKDRATSKLMSVGDATGTTTLYEHETTTTEYDTFTSRGALNGASNLLVNVNGQLVIVSQNQQPMVWDGTGSVANMAAATGTESNPTGGVALSAFGRLFITSVDGKTVFGSELQPDPKTTGINWDNWFIDTTGNSGGSAKDGWTFGRDFITGLGALGSLFIIFGQNSILVLSDVNGTVTLADSITGVGCVNQHTIQNTGDDIIFLSNSGLRSLRRTLEKESPPSTDASAFIEETIQNLIGASSAVSGFNQKDNFYLLSDGSEAYAFDMAGLPLAGGARRVSSWTLTPDAMTYDPENNRLFMAVGDAVGDYTGYQDDGASYEFLLKSAWLDFRNQQQKIVKKMTALVHRGDGYTPTFYLAFDWNKSFERSYDSQVIPTPAGISEWGDTTAGKGWGEAEWGGYVDQVTACTVRPGGVGQFVRYGIGFDVDGEEVGLHEVRVYAKQGRLSHV